MCLLTLPFDSNLHIRLHASAGDYCKLFRHIKLIFSQIIIHTFDTDWLSRLALPLYSTLSSKTTVMLHSTHSLRALAWERAQRRSDLSSQVKKGWDRKLRYFVLKVRHKNCCIWENWTVTTYRNERIYLLCCGKILRRMTKKLISKLFLIFPYGYIFVIYLLPHQLLLLHTWLFQERGSLWTTYPEFSSISSLYSYKIWAGSYCVVGL